MKISCSKNKTLVCGTIGFMFLLLAGCSDNDYYYSDEVGEKTIDQWNGEYVQSRVWAGVILNIIPGIHLAGLIMDTLYVYSAIDDIVYGVGAIKARELSCSGLVEEEDYDLFFAWEGGEPQEIMAAFREMVSTKSDVEELSDHMERRFAARVAPLVKKKIQKKLISKLGSKILIKVFSKALLGFIPVVGASAAGIINYIILDDLFEDSQQYFEEKSKIVC